MFGVDQPLLASADVHQQADGQRQIGFAGEVLDLLLLAVFEQVEVAFLQVADQGVVLCRGRCTGR